MRLSSILSLPHSSAAAKTVCSDAQSRIAFPTVESARHVSSYSDILSFAAAVLLPVAYGNAYPRSLYITIPSLHQATALCRLGG